mgnify:CR=1 FL=1
MDGAEEIEIETFKTKPDHIDFQTENVKTALCCQLINKKFKVLVLSLLVIIMLLEIFKLAWPAMSKDDQTEISSAILKGMKYIAKKFSGIKSQKQSLPSTSTNYSIQSKTENENLDCMEIFLFNTTYCL